MQKQKFVGYEGLLSEYLANGVIQVKKVFSRHSYGFAKNPGPPDDMNGRGSRGSGGGRTPTPSGRRSAAVRVQATEATASKSSTNHGTQNTNKRTGGIENVDTQKGGEAVEEKPTPTAYSSQRSREIKRWMARVLSGQAEDTSEGLAPVEVVVEGSRTKAKFTAEVMEEWLEGALAATAGVACPGIGMPDQKLWFGKDSYSLKRKRDMIGDKVKAAISSIETLVSSRFRKRIKFAKVDEIGGIKLATSDGKIEEEKPTIEKNIIPPMPVIEIIDNTSPHNEIQASSSPTPSLRSEEKSILLESIVPPVVEDTLPMFTTKSSRALDDNILSPITKTEVRAGASRNYLPTIRGKNKPTSEKDMSPTFATKSSNIFDKNVLSPTNSMAAKPNNNRSTIHAKGKGRANYSPTTPIRKSSTPIKNVLIPVVENMATPVIADSSTFTKSSTRINSVLKPPIKKMVTAVIAGPSGRGIRGKTPSKILMKHIPTTAKNISTVRDNVVASTAEKESISISGQSVSGKASSKIPTTRRPLANKNNTAINKILTPGTENRAGPTSGVKFTPVKVKPTADVKLNTLIESDVKSAFKLQSIPTVRKVIPAPAAAIRVSPRKYKPVRETTIPPVENVFTPTPNRRIKLSIRRQSTPTVGYVESIVSPTTATKVTPTTRKNSFPAFDKKVKNEKAIPTTETSPSKSTKSPAIGGIKAWPLKQTPSLYPRKSRCLDAVKETLTTKKKPVEIRPVRRILFLD